MTRVIGLLLLVLLALFAWQPAHATCTPSGQNASCTIASEAQAWASSHQVDVSANCAVNKPPQYGVFSDPVHKRYLKTYGCGTAATLAGPSGIDISASYVTDDTCYAGKKTLIDEWSTGSNNDIPATAAQCYNLCNVNWVEGAGGAHWVLAYERFTAQGTVTTTGTSCSATPPATTTPPAQPDTDQDGIPNDRDPYPTDPGNTAPQPPDDTDPPDLPQPPQGDDPATAGDIGTLAQTITHGLDLIGNALNALSTQASAAKESADVNAAATQAAVAAGAAQVASAVSALGGVSGGTGTDMTATNALLQAGNDQRAMLVSTASDMASVVSDQNDFLHTQLTSAANDLHGDLSEPGSSSGAIDANTDIGVSGLNDGGYGWSRSCPQNPAFSVFAHPFVLDLSLMCTWFGLGGALVLVAAALMSVRILAGALA